MAIANSKAITKPAKPHRDFPLFAHRNGQWCKKIKGRFHYFGPWADPQSALECWLDEKDDLLAGRVPRSRGEGPTLMELRNEFLTDRNHKLRHGELSQRSFDDYSRSCDRLLEHLGDNRLLVDIAPSDLLELREQLAAGWNSTTLGNEITRMRVIMNFAFKHAMIDSPIRFGAFTKPSARTMRVERANRPSKMFEASEILSMLEVADVQLTAMILLGVNCGLGNTDIGNLSIENLDLDAGWLNYPRPKTGIPRRCKLWPETVDALRYVLSSRRYPKDIDSKLVFLTRYGNGWVRGKIDPISRKFTKLVKRLQIHRQGVGFYGLRHMTETIGGECKDQVAVDAVMGHARNDMASVYRERISDERLEDVAGVIHQWLFGWERRP